MLDTLDISASALTAQRVRMDTIAGNIANMNTARYRRRFVVLGTGQPGDAARPGVHVKKVGIDQTPFRKVLDWNHPERDAQGYVQMPNVDLAIEMVNAMEASRAYEASITTMETTKAMINASLRLLA